MDIDNLTGEQIKSIDINKPEKIFSGNEANVKGIYRKLSIKWHPDKNKGDYAHGEVFAHLNLLYKMAIKRLNNGTLNKSEQSITIESIDNQIFIFRYLKSKNFEMGNYFIANNFVMWCFEIEYKDLVLSGLNNIKEITYADKMMEENFHRYVPQIEKTIETSTHFYVVIKKDKAFLNLDDIHGYNGHKIEPRHTAWILSTLYNNVCFIHYNSFMHGGINLDNYFINPETHEGILLGGWWYSQKEHQKLLMLSIDAVDVAPVSLINNKHAEFLLDLEMIKKLGRRLLGDVSGMYLNKNKDIPYSLIEWLRDGSKGTAIEQYSEWNQSILPESFGKRTFVVMNVKSSDLYREV